MALCGKLEMSSDVSSSLSFPFNQGRSIQIIYLCHKKEPLLIKNSRGTKGQHFISINHRLPFHIHNIWIRRKIENVRNMSFEPYDKTLTLAVETISINYWKPVTTGPFTYQVHKGGNIFSQSWNLNWTGGI